MCRSKTRAVLEISYFGSIAVETPGSSLKIVEIRDAWMVGVRERADTVAIKLASLVWKTA